MMTSHFTRLAALAALASLSACKTTQPAAPVAVVPKPAAVYVPAPEPVVAAPAPVYVEPDYTTLPGHSSYTTAVPVEPVDVQEMGPVIGP